MTLLNVVPDKGDIYYITLDSDVKRHKTGDNEDRMTTLLYWELDLRDDFGAKGQNYTQNHPNVCLVIPYLNEMSHEKAPFLFS